MTKEDLLTFIKSKNYAVVTTAGADGQPEAALIGFGETDAFELVFGTYKTSRKYRNLLTNPKVALVIGLGDSRATVQYEGTATELTGDELETYTSILFAKRPQSKPFKSNPDQSYWKITPRWIRYTDLAEDMEQVAEFTF